LVFDIKEVAFVFFNIVGRGPDTTFVGAPPRYEDLAREMASRWIAFVVNGDPNGMTLSNARSFNNL
jgi:hypothetical protein